MTSAAAAEKNRAYMRARDLIPGHREQRYARQRLARQRNAIDVRALKLLRGCEDCGYDDNADALQFDHLPGTGKVRNVAALVDNLTELRVELAKCDVVCANCHSIRTATRRRAAA